MYYYKMADNVFGDSQFSLDSIGDEQRAQIAKNRALIEQKEKGVDMAKTVGETKLFMSGHGIMDALKPLKPRIKKLAGRKANEFKKTIKNKITDYKDGDGGKSRRFNEFKAEQDDLNKKSDFDSVKKRFGKLSDEDKDSIRENLKNNPEFTSTEDLEKFDEAEPDYSDISSKADFKIQNDKMKSKLSNLDDDTKDQVSTDIKNDPNVKSSQEIKDISDPDEQLSERVKRSNAINDKINDLNPEKDVAMEKNTQLLRDQVSQKETNNFMENDANEVAEEESTSTLDNVKNAVSDVASRAKNAISNVFKSGDDTLNTSTNAVNGAVDDAKAVLKTEAKSMAEGEVESTVADTAAGLGSAALDAIPGADIIGAIMGAGIAIKKAIQVKRLEKKDENVIADAPVVGSLQQIL